MARPRIPDGKINAILDYHRHVLRGRAMRRALGVSGETIRRYARLYEAGKVSFDYLSAPDCRHDRMTCMGCGANFSADHAIN